MGDGANTRVEETAKSMQESQMKGDAGLGVVYGPMVWSDLDDIVTTFDATWGHCSPAAGNPQISRLLSAHFVLHYLALSTHAEVARIGGRFMAVLLSRVEGRLKLFPQIDKAIETVDGKLNATDLGRKVLAQTEHGFKVERAMESQVDTPHTMQAEVELFMAAASARGKGIGGELWKRSMDFFTQTEVSRFFLHTDSSCDVSFYEAHGLDKLAERKLEVTDGSDTADTMYIYAGDPGKVVHTRRR